MPIFRARTIVSQLFVCKYMSENLKRRITLFQSGFRITAEPNRGGDLIRRRDLDAFRHTSRAVRV